MLSSKNTRIFLTKDQPGGLEVKKIMQDTNAYARLLAGEEDVLDVIGAAETISMSIFVLGELYA